MLSLSDPNVIKLLEHVFRCKGALVGQALSLLANIRIGCKMCKIQPDQPMLTKSRITHEQNQHLLKQSLGLISTKYVTNILQSLSDKNVIKLFMTVVQGCSSYRHKGALLRQALSLLKNFEIGRKGLARDKRSSLLRTFINYGCKFL